MKRGPRHGASAEKTRAVADLRVKPEVCAELNPVAETESGLPPPPPIFTHLDPALF